MRLLMKFENKYLNEYNSQIENILSENEVKSYADYSFYDVYDVTIGGYDGGGEGCACCLIVCGGACVCWAMQTQSCGF